MNRYTMQFFLAIVVFCVTLATCNGFGSSSSSSDTAAHRTNSFLGTDTDNMDDSDNNIDKRSERYAFGLGRRAYTYTSGGSGVKRLPVYNFGLGKRARPYSFGLGKRADLYDDYVSEMDGYDNLGSMGYGDKYDNLKRGRPYSFGLGKRNLLDSDVERRSSAQRYNFGLGRR